MNTAGPIEFRYELVMDESTEGKPTLSATKASTIWLQWWRLTTSRAKARARMQNLQSASFWLTSSRRPYQRGEDRFAAAALAGTDVWRLGLAGSDCGKESTTRYRRAVQGPENQAIGRESGDGPATRNHLELSGWGAFRRHEPIRNNLLARSLAYKTLRRRRR